MNRPRRVGIRLLVGTLAGVLTVLVITLVAPASMTTAAVAAPATVAGVPAAVAGVPAAPGPVVPDQPAPPNDPADTSAVPGSPGDVPGDPQTDPSLRDADGTVSSDGGTVSVDINGVDGKPSTSIVVILAITVLSVAPALLLMTTSFTKIIVVLSLTRNALGLQNTPPNQVLAGLALFLSLFVMGPVLSDVNAQGVQPYLRGEATAAVAFERGVQPLTEFMLDHTRQGELALMTKAADRPLPADRDDVPLTTLVPAFVLSELKAAFIIGFVVFVPFLVIDLVVSASLMSMGMMMLPPVVISLPFKLLLFVLVDGWGLVVTALVSSYTGGGG